MPKRTYIFAAILTGFLIIIFAIGYLYLKQQKLMTQRHHLVCEVLKPGMSISEVETILDHVGSYTTSEGDWGNGSIVLGIHFTNPKIDDQYSTFGLAFIDYKYFRAYIEHGSDNPEIICDFYNPSGTLTGTPTSAP